MTSRLLVVFFSCIDAATCEIYTLSLHDALPISGAVARAGGRRVRQQAVRAGHGGPAQRTAPGRRGTPGRIAAHRPAGDRNSTPLNSSHPSISYAVFCLKKKTQITASSTAGPFIS